MFSFAKKTWREKMEALDGCHAPAVHRWAHARVATRKQAVSHLTVRPCMKQKRKTLLHRRGFKRSHPPLLLHATCLRTWGESRGWGPPRTLSSPYFSLQGVFHPGEAMRPGLGNRWPRSASSDGSRLGDRIYCCAYGWFSHTLKTHVLWT